MGNNIKPQMIRQYIDNKIYTARAYVIVNDYAQRQILKQRLNIVGDIDKYNCFIIYDGVISIGEIVQVTPSISAMKSDQTFHVNGFDEINCNAFACDDEDAINLFIELTTFTKEPQYQIFKYAKLIGYGDTYCRFDEFKSTQFDNAIMTTIHQLTPNEYVEKRLVFNLNKL